ncbi:hypothetical protein [Nostocoides veronense]|uniref:Antitoxin n=1 Tax=Nostocoides veronense TaxID=330836 RepID=A0ABN2LJ24_9MICO
MPSVQVKNVPDEVLAVHHRRARAAHQSLQEYLLQRLTDDAARATWDEVLAEVAALDRHPLNLDSLNQMIREDRESH